MTDTNELRKLLEKATPLPWREVVTRYERQGECIESASLDDVGCPTRVVDASSSGMEGGGFVRGEDLRLVVSAINALPSMLDQLEARSEEAQRLNRIIGDSGAWTIQAVQELDAARADLREAMELLRAHGHPPTWLDLGEAADWNTRYGRLLKEHKETP